MFKVVSGDKWIFGEWKELIIAHCPETLKQFAGIAVQFRDVLFDEGARNECIIVRVIMSTCFSILQGKSVLIIDRLFLILGS